MGFGSRNFPPADLSPGAGESSAKGEAFREPFGAGTWLCEDTETQATELPPSTQLSSVLEWISLLLCDANEAGEAFSSSLRQQHSWHRMAAVNAGVAPTLQFVTGSPLGLEPWACKAELGELSGLSPSCLPCPRERFGGISLHLIEASAGLLHTHKKGAFNGAKVGGEAGEKGAWN